MLVVQKVKISDVLTDSTIVERFALETFDHGLGVNLIDSQSHQAVHSGDFVGDFLE